MGAKLIPLTQGELIISRIRLEGADFYLRRDADGHANWDEAIQSFRNRAAAPKGPTNAPGPQIAGFELRDSSLTYVDGGSGKRFQISKWLLDVGEWKAGATFPVETKLTFRNESLANTASAGAPSRMRRSKSICRWADACTCPMTPTTSTSSASSPRM